MKLIEKKQDLFKVDEKYYLAHCISDDFAMGAGIAVQFQNRYKLREKLFKKCSNGFGGAGCVLVDNVFNLITKQHYYNKPTLDTLQKSIIHMRDLTVEKNVKYLAIPKIGCGLDKLKWNDVKEIIQDVFQNTNIEILVCSL